MSRFDDEMDRIRARIREVVEEREQEEAAPLLHQLIATYPGTLGQRVALARGADMAMRGRAEAGGALVEMGGAEFVRALFKAGASSPVLQSAIETALLIRYRELPAFIGANGGRAEFASWCRQAEFTIPETLPDTLTIYRGTMGCSPAAAATGLHWTDTFEKACFFACRFADEHLTGVIVLKAEVRRDELVAFLEAAGEHELIPAAVPTSYEVVTDHALIGAAGHRAMIRYRDLIAQGHPFIPTLGMAEQAAMATRTRMAAAGVAQGAAIVA